MHWFIIIAIFITERKIEGKQEKEGQDNLI